MASRLRLAGTGSGSRFRNSVIISTKIHLRIGRGIQRRICTREAEAHTEARTRLKAPRRRCQGSKFRQAKPGLFARNATKRRLYASKSGGGGSRSGSSNNGTNSSSSNNNGSSSNSSSSGSGNVWVNRGKLVLKIGLGLSLATGTNMALSEGFAAIDFKFPSGIAGMVLACSLLSSGSRLCPSAASRVAKFLSPTVDWVSLHLSLLFVPALVMLPTLHSSEEHSEVSMSSLASIVGLGMLGSYVSTVGLGRALSRLGMFSSANSALKIQKVDAQHIMRLSAPLWFAILALGAPFALANPEDPIQCLSFMMGLTGFGYSTGHLLPAAIRSFLPPIGTSMLLTWAGVWALARAGDSSFEKVLTRAYIPTKKDKPNGGSQAPDATAEDDSRPSLSIAGGSAILGLLDASLVIAGVQAYNFLPLIRSCAPGLLISTLIGAGANIVGMAAIARAFGVDESTSVSLLTRGVTTAMAIPINEMLTETLEAEPQGVLTAGISSSCGLFGAMCIPALSRFIAGATVDASVRGIAAGTAAHGLGAALYSGVDPRAFVFGVVAFGMVGAWSAVLLLDGSPVRSVAMRIIAE